MLTQIIQYTESPLEHPSYLLPAQEVLWHI